jgi:gliding motility-associated-like protein
LKINLYIRDVLTKEMTSRRSIIFILLWALSSNLSAQLTASAGDDKTVCPGLGLIIGGSPTANGGLPPYTYSWKPTTALDNPAIANPISTPTQNMTYTVTVTDDTGAVKTDFMILTINDLYKINAGRDTSICVNQTAFIGSFSNPGGISYSWSPGSTLSDSTSTAPISYPGLSSVTYTLTATATGCPPRTDVVRVNVIPTPLINAGPDVTIQEGEVAILNASGAFYYEWKSGPTLNYVNSESCDAEPKITTTYILGGLDETGTCPAFDEITVYVIPNDKLVIYNTFPPNNDGQNDFWYIGNIYKYPDNILQVYNRYGKLVYRATGYQNDWDGRVSGEGLPDGTYFYDLDPGDGSEKYHGTITIIK